jgi:hypothetical protein
VHLKIILLNFSLIFAVLLAGHQFLQQKSHFGKRRPLVHFVILQLFDQIFVSNLKPKHCSLLGLSQLNDQRSAAKIKLKFNKIIFKSQALQDKVIEPVI